MKHIVSFVIACLICIAYPATTIAQENYQIPEEMPINNGELDWWTYNDKFGEIKLEKKELIIKSKKGKKWGLEQPGAMTYAKVPINMDGDFYISITFKKPSKIDEDYNFGFIFDVTNENFFQTILFNKDFSYYANERAKYKYIKKGKDLWTVAIERRNGGDYIVTLNGLEIRTIPSTFKFSSPSVGIYVKNKCEVKATHVAYIQWAAAPESNE